MAWILVASTRVSEWCYEIAIKVNFDQGKITIKGNFDQGKITIKGNFDQGKITIKGNFDQGKNYHWGRTLGRESDSGPPRPWSLNRTECSTPCVEFWISSWSADHPDVDHRTWQSARPPDLVVSVGGPPGPWSPPDLSCVEFWISSRSADHPDLGHRPRQSARPPDLVVSVSGPPGPWSPNMTECSTP